jgi:uncharacterized membrane protein
MRLQLQKMVSIAAVTGWLSLGGCGGDDGASNDKDAAVEETGCKVTAPDVCPDPAPQYVDVEPIFRQRCISCHSGAVDAGVDAPWGLTTHEEISHWPNDIRVAMLSCTMPPQDSGVTMTVAERERILDWLLCGMPPALADPE